MLKENTLTDLSDKEVQVMTKMTSKEEQYFGDDLEEWNIFLKIVENRLNSSNPCKICWLCSKLITRGLATTHGQATGHTVVGKQEMLGKSTTAEEDKTKLSNYMRRHLQVSKDDTRTKYLKLENNELQKLEKKSKRTINEVNNGKV